MLACTPFILCDEYIVALKGLFMYKGYLNHGGVTDKEHIAAVYIFSTRDSLTSLHNTKG